MLRAIISPKCLTAAVMAIGLSLSAPAFAENPTGVTAKHKGPRKQCNGSTTTECCAGLSYCSCLFMPGSTKDRPTACFPNDPPAK